MPKSKVTSCSYSHQWHSDQFNKDYHDYNIEFEDGTKGQYTSTRSDKLRQVGEELEYEIKKTLQSGMHKIKIIEERQGGGGFRGKRFDPEIEIMKTRSACSRQAMDFVIAYLSHNIPFENEGDSYVKMFDDWYEHIHAKVIGTEQLVGIKSNPNPQPPEPGAEDPAKLRQDTLLQLSDWYENEQGKFKEVYFNLFGKVYKKGCLDSMDTPQLRNFLLAVSGQRKAERTVDKRITEEFDGEPVEEELPF